MAFLGTPAAWGSTSFDPADRSVFDPFSGRRFGAQVAGPDTYVMGDAIASFEGTGGGLAERWIRGNGYLRVNNLVSGTERYRVTGSRVARAAGSSATAMETASAKLLSDGSLQLMLLEKHVSRRGLRPTWIDRHGRVRTLPWRIPRAVSLTTAAFGGRILVRFARYVGAGTKARSCDGWWLSDAAGERGGRIALRDPAGRDRQDLGSWDRRYAVFRTERTTPPKSEGIRVDAGLHQLALTRHARPTCRL